MSFTLTKQTFGFANSVTPNRGTASNTTCFEHNQQGDSIACLTDIRTHKLQQYDTP
jgi:hypothetical protein